jgi:hypothetical protein
MGNWSQGFRGTSCLQLQKYTCIVLGRLQSPEVQVTTVFPNSWTPIPSTAASHHRNEVLTTPQWKPQQLHIYNNTCSRNKIRVKCVELTTELLQSVISVIITEHSNIAYPFQTWRHIYDKSTSLHRTHQQLRIYIFNTLTSINIALASSPVCF